MLSAKSIKLFIALKTAPWIALFLLIAGLSIAFIERFIFNDELESHHETRIDRFAENKQRVLDGFVGQVNAIASNDLVINGLIDIQNGEQYLSALINSYLLVGTTKNSVKVVDYNGDIITSNEIEVSVLPAVEISFFDDVINLGVSSYEYLPEGVVFISPIILGSAAEGAVIVEVPYGDLKELYTIDIFGGEIIYANDENKILYASNDELASQFIKNSNKIDESIINKDYQDWYVLAKLMPNGRTVYSFEDKNILFDNLYWFVFLGVASLIVACLGALISIILSSSIISKTLNNLLNTLRKGKIDKNYLNARIASHDGPEELSRVYQDFYWLLQDLNRSESFGNDIKSIINSLDECLVVFDMNGQVILSNHSFKNLSDNILGDVKVFDKVIPKSLREEALSTKGILKDFECVYSIYSSEVDGLNDEPDRVIRWSRSLYLTPENTVGGLTFIGADVTDQKISENEIADKNRKIKDLSRRFNLALEAAGIGVWEFNIDTGSLIWDDRMHEIYHVDKQAFSGSIEDWSARVHPVDLEVVNQRLSKCLKSGEDFLSDFRIIWPSDEVRWVSANARVINDDGKLRVVGVNIDVTETKRLNHELEDALKKAEGLVKIKSDFLASMSHEIRTPMNGVLGMLTLLKKTNLNFQQSRYIELAHSSADSLLILINDILDFSKVDAGKLELDCIDFNLPDLLGELTESLAQRAHEKGLELVLDIADIEIETVNSDPGRIRQILTNLIGNSIKFTEQGEVTIVAKIQSEDNGQLGFTASIIDTGIGIPEDKIDTLFDSFSQVDASTTRKYGGTGLGLAIVKKLCRLMGGDISIQPNVLSGSQFDFSLKFNQPKRLVNHSVAVSSDHNVLDLNQKFIIIIDDNFAYTVALYKQLSAWNARVMVMHKAIDTLSFLEGEDIPDIILIDDDMSDMKGIDFVKKIREEKRFQSIRLVLMTNVSSDFNLDIVEAYQATTSLIKPITRKDFIRCLNEDNIANDASNPTIGSTINNQKSENLNNKVKQSLIEGTKRILLVEDNLINQEVALGMLESLNFKTDIAENGHEAIKILSSHTYDIILMDCQMPEMDGYEATRAIRVGKTLQSNIPIIAMTANAMKGDREKCLAAGMDDYLSKPINPNQLVDKINEWSVTQMNEPKTTGGSIMASIKDNNENTITWDRNDFMNRIMNNETLAHKLIDLFKVDTPKTLDQLSDAIDDGQVKEAGLLAHKLKGTVSNLGGVDLASLAYQIEQAGREDDMESIKALWPMVRPKYNQLLEMIERDF